MAVMTAKDLDKMVSRMNISGAEISTRGELQDMVYLFFIGLKACGKDDLSQEMCNLYTEIESIESADLVKLDTFR